MAEFVAVGMVAGMRALFVAYVVVGVGAWVVYAWGLAVARVRMGKVKVGRGEVAAPQPEVTVIIPAKDEGEGLRKCLDSVLRLDYPEFSVVAVNDRSGDQTGAIMDEYARRDSRVRVIHVEQLPAGWLGKCHALDLGVRGATSPWLLFVDSDVQVEASALRDVLGPAVTRGYDAVSLLSRLECHGFWERLVMPLAAAAVSSMYHVSLTNNDDRKESAFANGQFFLIRREAYEKVGGHAAVRAMVTEDVDLMRLLKRSGFRTRLFFGRKLVATRMYDSLPKMVRGWSRIYAGASHRRPWKILGAMAFVVLGGLSGYVALAVGLITGSALLTAVAVGHLVFMMGLLAVAYRWSWNQRRYALLFPVGAGVLLWTFARALKSCATGEVSWRGTSYSGLAPAGVSVGSARPTKTLEERPRRRVIEALEDRSTP